MNVHQKPPQHDAPPTAPDAPPAFDRGAVHDHAVMLHELAKGANVDGVLVLACYGEDPRTGRKTSSVVQRFAIGDVAENVAAIMDQEHTPHLNVYMGLHVMRPGLTGGERGGLADLRAILALPVDLDGDTGRAGALPFDPPYSIESSAGNFQPVYPLARALSPAEAKPIADALQAATGSDHGTKDLAHVWRVPGTLNWPNAKKLERGRPLAPQVVRVAVPWAGDLIEPEKLKEALGEHIKKSGGAETNNSESKDGRAWQLKFMALPASTKKLIVAPVLPGEDRSATAGSVIFSLLRQGWSNGEIAAVIRAHPQGVGARYAAEDNDLEADVERLRRKFDDKQQSQGTQEQASPRQPSEDEEIFDAAELEKMEFDPVKSVVPGVFVEGLTLFCGKPKLGKSWLLLHAAHAIASGGFTLGLTHCIEGDVLYCSLEDNKRRLKSRMRKLFGDRPRSPRLKFKIKMPRLAEGGIAALRAWIKSVPNPRLVAIDTLAMVRMPNRKDQSAYDADYAAVIELRNLAHELGIAIVVVHHVRKMDADDPFDTISGTLGLTGCPDSLVILKRDTTGTMLLGRGRDLEELEKAITFNKQSCTWTIEGDADEVRRSTQQQAILATLQEANMPMTPKQIASDVGMKVQNVKRLLGKMVADGILQKAGYGEYELAAKKQEADFG